MAVYRLDGESPELPAGFCWIAPSAAVIGRVRLFEDTGIWFGAVLRGDIEAIIVGAGSNVQDNAVLHTDAGFPLRIGAGCTIGHRAILHGCSIGDTTLIGMGATILNGAVIGNNCLIGAGALVTEGKTIPDNSLVVGVPGKVIRQIDAEGEAMLRASAALYVANAKRFAAGLELIEPDPGFAPA
ncbi:MAG: gamma carbonic anhydrase family protein [Devosia sp.]|nr:gamma carbonic anhydrase family protein [Devosia sp.]